MPRKIISYCQDARNIVTCQLESQRLESYPQVHLLLQTSQTPRVPQWSYHETSLKYPIINQASRNYTFITPSCSLQSRSKVSLRWSRTTSFSDHSRSFGKTIVRSGSSIWSRFRFREIQKEDWKALVNQRVGMVLRWRCAQLHPQHWPSWWRGRLIHDADQICKEIHVTSRDENTKSVYPSIS